MDGASDDNALGLSALSARGAVFPAEPEGDDAREAAFTDDSTGDANEPSALDTRREVVGGPESTWRRSS